MSAAAGSSLITPSQAEDSAVDRKELANGLSVEAALRRIAAEGLWSEFERKSQEGGRISRLSAPLAAICRLVAWRDNRQDATHLFWCVTVIMWLSIPFDYSLAPYAVTAIVAGHGVLTTLALALALRAWRHPRLEWMQNASASLFAFVVMIAAIMTGHRVGGPNFERFVLVGFFGMTTGLVLLPLTTPWMALVTFVLNVCFVVSQSINPAVDGASGFLFTLYCSAISVVVIWARYQINRRQIRATLSRLREAHSKRLMREMAHTDALTGLRNRKAITDEFARLIGEARPGTVLSVAMIDIDDFKKLNDTLGHASGDEALRSVGSLFSDFARTSGAVCGRIGGEEFLALLPGAGAEAATRAVESLMRDLDRMNLSNPGSRVADRVTLSVGLVTASLGEGRRHHQESLMRDADLALYEAKNAGRNRIVAVAASSLNDDAA